jgi:hypothetical protein
MAHSLTERYDDRIAGILSCYDRLLITGTDCAASLATTTGITIEHISKSYIRKEEVVGRGVPVDLV